MRYFLAVDSLSFSSCIYELPSDDQQLPVVPEEISAVLYVKTLVYQAFLVTGNTR